jgi:hypothetical protein
VQNNPYWKQVDRIYMVSSSARSAAKSSITMFKGVMLAALLFTGLTIQRISIIQIHRSDRGLHSQSQTGSRFEFSRTEVLNL